jgi:hypothetical protein
LSLFLLRSPLSFLAFPLLLGRPPLSIVLSPYILVLDILQILGSTFPLGIEDEALIVLSLAKDACPSSQ